MKTKIKLVLPIIALLLNVYPYYLFLRSLHYLFLFWLAPFVLVGLIIAIVHICLGKKRIGRPAMIISIVAAAWPLVFTGTVVLMHNMNALLSGI